MSDWIQIRAEFAEAPADWSIYASCCEEHGCPSSLQTDSPPELYAYLEDTPASQPQAISLKESLLKLGAKSVSILSTPDEDWTEIWKLHFKPMRIGKRLVICPSWETFEPVEGDIVISLDPGQAFGTGDHSTTKLCLQLLERFVSPQTTSLLDLGTGSGILSIAAKKLGAQQVVGTDIDPVATAIAKQNAERNSVDCDFECFGGVEDSISKSNWQIVVSNIISATLIRLAPQVFGLVSDGGFWIVSGIINTNWEDVLAAATKSGFSLVEKNEEGDWVAAVFRKVI